LETSPGTNVAKRQIRWSHGALAGARGSHAGFLGWNWNRMSPPVRSAMAGTVSPSFRVPVARVCRSAVHLGAVVGDVQDGHGAPLPSHPYRVATQTLLCNRAGQREPRQDGSSESALLAESQPLRADGAQGVDGK